MIDDRAMACEVLTLLYHDVANHQGPQCCDDGEHMQLLADACDFMIEKHTVPVIMFDDGRIENGEYEGLYTMALAICMRDSSWDFPSYVGAMGLSHLFVDEEPTMHPQIDDVILIADMMKFNDKSHNEFVLNFPLDWDT